MAKDGAKAEVPQYKLTERAYIDDRLLEPGAVIYYEGVPGPHMAPVNESAKAMVAKHKPMKVDPVEKLSIIGPGAQTLQPQP